MDLKKQSEYSGLRPGTSSLVFFNGELSKTKCVTAADCDSLETDLDFQFSLLVCMFSLSYLFKPQQKNTYAQIDDI